MWLYCAMAAVALWGCSGVPGLFGARRSAWGERAATALGVGGSGVGLTAALTSLIAGGSGSLQFRGPMPGVNLHLRLDGLSAFFLVLVFLIGAIGSIYGLSYWAQARHQRTGRKLRFWYGLLIAALALVLLAADGILFLFAWEIMALSAFFLVSTEHQKKQVREAGWLYLVAAHVGTLVLFALFALLRLACGSFELRRLDDLQAGSGLGSAIFVTALVGFGLKAGVMPLHFWLPAAHANAPSHVSAILSGVVLKIGIYGILRTLTILPTQHASRGGMVLLLGTASAVVGVLFALGQHDLKRLLAYHSVENIGIILMGLGLAMIGQARGRPDWIVLGMAGCLLHVWNHALFKSLLFLAAGAVVHEARTREIDQMGGLAKSMPMTAILFFIGAVAICGLPPLNGFVSELLIYLGLFRTLDASSAVALAAPPLAMVGAFAVACFVKGYGAVFLGVPRRRPVEHVRDAAPAMVLSMMTLAIGCGLIGVLPRLLVHPVQNVISQWSRTPVQSERLGALAPLAMLTPLALLLAGVTLAGWLWVRRSWLRQPRMSITWDCGYAQPSARMQYTSSSFAQGLVGLFRIVLRPMTHGPKIRGMFPLRSGFRSHVNDIVLDRVLVPWWRRLRSELARLRFLQQGSIQSYLLYILLTLLVLLLFAVPIVQMIRGLFVSEAP